MKREILYVEDDGDVAGLVVAVLTDYNVTVCRDAKTGLECLRANRDKFHVIITDYHNGQPGGGALIAQEVRTYSPGVPVIVVSGAVKSWQEIYDSCHADAYIEKPFMEITDLITAVEDCLELHAVPSS
jgi:DNA-binding NtrC family response regulator